MSATFLRFLMVSIPALLAGFAYGQGCSDAGFCTMSSFKPNHTGAEASKNRFAIGSSFGKADHSILVIGSYLEYTRQVNAGFSMDAKIASLVQSGNDIAVFGLSDIYLNATRRIGMLKLMVGAKIPLTDGNRQRGNLSLPMDYQASLGTFDLIIGLGYKIRRFQFALGLQQPLTQNRNRFASERFPPDSKLRAFISTNQFKRSGDVLLRVSYPIKAGEKLKITPSILPIYHLTNDTYTDSLNVKREITGSQGLTFNGNLYLDYEVTGSGTIQLSFGTPFVFRQKRPDGLTRHYIINLEYKMAF